MWILEPHDSAFLDAASLASSPFPQVNPTIRSMLLCKLHRFEAPDLSPLQAAHRAIMYRMVALGAQRLQSLFCRMELGLAYEHEGA